MKKNKCKFFVIVLFLVFGVVLSFTIYKNNSNLVYNYNIGNLKYYISSNTGTDNERKVFVKAKSTKKVSLRITSQNKMKTNYEITYKKDKDISVKKIIDSNGEISDTINPYETKIIDIAVTNNSNEDKNVILDLNASKSNEELALKNQINEMYYNDNVTILAYVDGNSLSSNKFPEGSGYTVSGSCKVDGVVKKSIKVTGEYIIDGNNSYWDIRVNNVTSPNTVCSVNFNNSNNIIELISIEVVNGPTKTQYKDGDTFDATGMIVNAIYSDETEEEITDYTITNSTMTLGQTSVTISYTEDGKTVSTTYPVTVKSKGIVLTDSTGTLTKTKDTLTVGDLVTIDTERFYVIEKTADYIAALAEYNLLVGNTCDSSGWNCETIEPSAIGYGLQNETAKGYGTDPVVGVTVYSSAGHAGNKCNTYEGSLVQEYVDDYVDKLQLMAGSEVNLTGNLIKKEQVEALKDFYKNTTGSKINTVETVSDWAPDWLYSVSYWSATAWPSSSSELWSFDATRGKFFASLYCSDDGRNGVRPVIEFSINE